ncbi:MAG: FkbM family methyltransferase [Sediminibacterium sp.]
MNKLIQFIKLFHRAYKYQKSDIGEIAYIKAAIKKGETVFDIGAHKAGYLYFIKKQVGPSGKVYAFEPQSNLFNYIKKLKALFNWDNVTLEHLAQSNTTGQAQLYLPTEEVGKTSSPGATIAANEDDTNFTSLEKVTTSTLDSYCAVHNCAPSFLKIDVEGNELNIFKGGFETLSKYKPKIIVEIESRHIGKENVMDTIRFLEAIGYKARFVKGSEYLPVSEFDFNIHQNRADKKNYCNNFIFE